MDRRAFLGSATTLAMAALPMHVHPEFMSPHGDDFASDLRLDLIKWINAPGKIAVDVSDVLSLLERSDFITASTGFGVGTERSKQATSNALAHDKLNIHCNIGKQCQSLSSTGMLAIIHHPGDLTIAEYYEVMRVARGQLSPETPTLVWDVFDYRQDDAMGVTVITGWLMRHIPSHMAL